MLVNWSLLLILAQAPSSSPVSSPLRVSGIVVDPRGEPIPEAQLTYTGTPVFVKTDSQGGFVVDTRGPALVIRKAGFQSVRLDLTRVGPLRVILQPELKRLPACNWRSSCDSLPGQSFCFPSVAGVTSSKPGRDIDYIAQAFTVATADGRAAIRHGAGQFWSYGADEKDVWGAEEYHETIYTFLGLQVEDARGRMPNGTYWRSLHIFQGVHEEASYHGVDQGAAVLLDRVLDGVCLRESKILKAARKAENQSKTH